MFCEEKESNEWLMLLFCILGGPAAAKESDECNELELERGLPMCGMLTP